MAIYKLIYRKQATANSLAFLRAEEGQSEMLG